jgi:hypothetical protein
MKKTILPGTRRFDKSKAAHLTPRGVESTIRESPQFVVSERQGDRIRA